MVHHRAATRSALGKRMNSAFKAISQPVLPVTAKPSRSFCESMIQVKPDATKRSVSCQVDGIACGMDASMSVPFVGRVETACDIGDPRLVRREAGHPIPVADTLTGHNLHGTSLPAPLPPILRHARFALLLRAPPPGPRYGARLRTERREAQRARVRSREPLPLGQRETHGRAGPVRHPVARGARGRGDGLPLLP